MQNVQRIVLVDFGAQYTQLIARRVREANVFCEVVSYLTPLSEILDKKPVGIILSGGPASVLDADAPHIDPAIYEQGIPVLGICYGMQLTAYTLGGTVERAAQREYGRIPVDFEGRLIVRFSEEEHEYDGEVLWLVPGEDEVDLAQYIYESIVLSLPYQRVHPEGECDPDMLGRFRIVSDEEFASIEAGAGGEERRGGEWAKLAELRERMEPGGRSSGDDAKD